MGFPAGAGNIKGRAGGGGVKLAQQTAAENGSTLIIVGILEMADAWRQSGLRNSQRQAGLPGAQGTVG